MLASIFEYSSQRFKNPYVITGLVFLVLGMLIIFLFGKLFEKKFLQSKYEKINKEEFNDEEMIKEKMKDIELKFNIIIKSIGFGVIIIGSIIALLGV